MIQTKSSNELRVKKKSLLFVKGIILENNASKLTAIS